ARINPATRRYRSSISIPLSPPAAHGLVPTSTLIDASSALSQVGPLTPAVPSLSKPGSNDSYLEAASRCEINPVANANAVASVSGPDPTFVRTRTPLTQRAAPIVTNALTFQPADSRISRIVPASAKMSAVPS